MGCRRTDGNRGYRAILSIQLKQNVDGKEFIVHGEFSTKIRPVENAKRIRIDSIALDVDIICWEPFQTHSVIYV